MDGSGSKTKELVHKTYFACRAGLRQDAVATTDHPHNLKAFDRCIGCFHPLETAGRPDQALERAVVCLDDIIEVF
jgi:hypothetical protein